jgi:hypothetical protein
MGDALTRRGDAEIIQMGIVTPTELKPLNQQIQWGIQTPGTHSAPRQSVI